MNDRIEKVIEALTPIFFLLIMVLAMAIILTLLALLVVGLTTSSVNGSLC